MTSDARAPRIAVLAPNPIGCGPNTGTPIGCSSLPDGSTPVRASGKTLFQLALSDDASGVASTTVKFAGLTVLHVEEPGSEVTWNLDTAGMTPGRYSMDISATDRLGHTSIASFSVFVDPDPATLAAIMARDAQVASDELTGLGAQLHPVTSTSQNPSSLAAAGAFEASCQGIADPTGGALWAESSECASASAAGPASCRGSSCAAATLRGASCDGSACIAASQFSDCRGNGCIAVGNTASCSGYRCIAIALGESKCEEGGTSCTSISPRVDGGSEGGVVVGIFSSSRCDADGCVALAPQGHADGHGYSVGWTSTTGDNAAIAVLGEARCNSPDCIAVSAGSLAYGDNSIDLSQACVRRTCTGPTAILRLLAGNL